MKNMHILRVFIILVFFLSNIKNSYANDTQILDSHIFISRLIPWRPIEWIDSNTVAFVGNIREYAYTENDLPDSLFVWKYGAEPRELLNKIAVHSQSTGLETENNEGFLFVSDDPRVASTFSYYRFNADFAEKITENAIDKTRVRANQLQKQKEIEKLQRKAAKISQLDAKNSYAYAGISLSPDRRHAFVMEDPTYSEASRKFNIKKWRGNNCWPYLDINLENENIASACIPYGGWILSAISLIPTRNEVFVMAKTNIGLGSDAPKLMGIYRISNQKLTKLIGEEDVGETLVSPDGCRVAIVSSSSQVKMWNVCHSQP